MCVDLGFACPPLSSGMGVEACSLLPAAHLFPANFWWGCLWRGGVRGLLWVGVVPPPPFFFVSGYGGGSDAFSPVVPWLCGVLRCLSRSWVFWSSSPLPLSFRLRACLFFSARHFSSRVCAGVSGVSFPPVGRCSWLGVAGSGRAVPRYSFGGPRGCCFRCGLARGFASLLWSGCVASWLCVCLLCPPLFFGLCCLLVSLFFSRGGLPVPASAFSGLVHALVGIQSD